MISHLPAYFKGNDPQSRQSAAPSGLAESSHRTVEAPDRTASSTTDSRVFCKKSLPFLQNALFKAAALCYIETESTRTFRRIQEVSPMITLHNNGVFLTGGAPRDSADGVTPAQGRQRTMAWSILQNHSVSGCLLYTSDAADEL